MYRQKTFVVEVLYNNTNNNNKNDFFMNYSSLPVLVDPILQYSRVFSLVSDIPIW